MQIELELLAPAKNREIGIAAVDCGADALYMAGPQFGAREAAGNSMDEIAATVAYAKQFGVKVYLTLNTILYDSELKAAQRLVCDAWEAGCAAVIVQDMALLKMELPPIRLFASTQANISSVEQALLLKNLGFERLILARELSLEQIAAIKQATGMDIECFVHGALCVSYSGQCYLSEFLTGRSANRGCCAQVCRSLYTLEDSSGRVYAWNEPLLSLRDLNLSGRIPDLVKAGVTSFKIEGRLKNSSYVKNNVKLYREAIDRFIAENPGYARASAGKICGGFTPNPNLTFNRGFTEYFIDGKRSRWRSEAAAKYIGEPVGRVTKCGKTAAGCMWFEYKRNPESEPIVNGDGLCFLKNGGDEKGGILGARANSCTGNKVVTTEKFGIPAGSPVYRNYNFLFERELEKNMPERIIEVSLKVFASAEKIRIKAGWEPCGELETEFAAPFPSARNRELAMENIVKQFGKRTGAFSFNVTETGFESDVPFIPLSVLNEMRRRLAEMITVDGVADGKTGKMNEETKIAPARLSYLANSSNHLSEELYLQLGAIAVDKAYELEHKEKAELMHTKYCIRYELGLCFKDNPERAKAVKEPLYLVNGEKRLKLRFDCKNCRMFVIG